MAVSLLGCTKPITQSSSTLTEAQAQKTLELRLAKTQEVRTQITAFRDALRPIDSILHDMGKAVDLKIDGHPGGPLAGLLERLEDSLRGSLNGVVNAQDDGSWNLEQPSPIALLAGAQSACASSRTRLSGVKLQGGEQFSIALSGCSNPDQFQTLAVVLVRMDGTRTITLSASTFEAVYRENLRVDQCRLNLDTSSYADFRCYPFSLSSGDFTFEMGRLEFHTDAFGTHAVVHAGLSDSQHGQLGTVDVAVEPNSPADVRVCTRGQSCGN